jgi:multiple sugar transport system ATP-binding protein
MNFVPARIDGSTLTLPFTSVALSSAARARVAGRELVMAGIRPEHFELAALLDDTKRAQGVTFRAEVGAVEWLGNQQFAYLPYDPAAELGRQLAARARELDTDSQSSQLIVSIDASSRLRAGESADFWFPEARIHLFDPESGANLICGAPAPC